VAVTTSRYIEITVCPAANDTPKCRVNGSSAIATMLASAMPKNAPTQIAGMSRRLRMVFTPPRRASVGERDARTSRHHRALPRCEVLHADLSRDMGGDVTEHAGNRRLGISSYNRSAGATADANGEIQRNGPEERKFVALGQFSAAAGTEDVGALI